MASALPHRPPITHTPDRQSTIEFGDRSSRRTFEALASETAREVFARLTTEPTTASEIATRTGISIQNAEYHLAQLSEADLIVEAGVWYSTRGKEMTVYAPRAEELVVRLPVSTGGAE